METTQTPKQTVLALLPALPLAPNDRWPPGATTEQIDGFQLRTGITLPDQLREWLSLCNGPLVGPGGIYGIGPERQFLDMDNHLASLPVWCGRNFLPIAGDGCGSNYALSVIPVDGFNPVYFIDHEDAGVLHEPSYVVASGLWHFLRFLFQEELGNKGWPFDRHLVLNQDPDLLKLDSRLLPWNR